MSEQDDTVLLEPEIKIDHVHRQMTEKQISNQRDINVGYKRRMIIQSFPYILFFVSLCMLMIYLLFYRP